MDINELLQQPLGTDAGAALIAWVEQLRGRVLAGEMMIGILSAEEVGLAPVALRRAIECGSDAAWLALAHWFSNPPVGEPDIDKAKEVLVAAMETKVLGAALRLVEVVWFYERESAAPHEQARIYSIAAELVRAHPEDGQARHILGLLTCQGFGTKEDPEEAFRLQTEAAAQGNPAAMFEAYVQLETGLGVTKDSERALRYLRSAADAGHSRALYNLGALYATGRGVEKDLAQAAAWYQRASDHGHVRATATLAAMYAKGQGVEQDLEYADQLLGEAEYMGLDVSALRASVGL